MFHAGDVIENPATGEQITFITTAAETDGEFVIVETIVQPGGAVATKHIHPHQEERFEVLEGSVGILVGGTTISAEPGDSLVVPPGTPTSSGTQAMPRLGSSARCDQHSTSSSCSARCSRSRRKVRRTPTACRTRFGSPSSPRPTQTPSRCRSLRCSFSELRSRLRRPSGGCSATPPQASRHRQSLPHPAPPLSGRSPDGPDWAQRTQSRLLRAAAPRVGGQQIA